jgi:Tfp pilus assembly ATPase PilU
MDLEARALEYAEAAQECAEAGDMAAATFNAQMANFFMTRLVSFQLDAQRQYLKSINTRSLL